jgi:hypothetical protein
MRIQYSDAFGRYLVGRYYGEGIREPRYCHARDLMLQAKTMCEFQSRPLAFTPEVIDQAVRNYFVEM